MHLRQRRLKVIRFVVFLRTHRFGRILVYQIRRIQCIQATILSEFDSVISFSTKNGFSKIISFVRLTMRTTVNVKEGEQLFMTYTYILSGTRSRQDLLSKGKFFSCNCERCSDPTELGTHFSSILCRKCQGGVIVPDRPLGTLL